MTTELTSMNLPQRVAFANQLAGQINEALDRAWKTAVVLGWELTRLKAELPHGEFGKLFNGANLNHGFNFTQQMANRYMRLYALCCEKAGQLGQAEALQALLGAIHPALSYRALPTPGGEAAPSLPSAGRRLAGFLHTLAPEAHSMRQAMFTFMAEAGEEKKPAGAPLPHMRQQTARPAHTRHLAEMVQPGKPPRPYPCRMEHPAEHGGNLHPRCSPPPDQQRPRLLRRPAPRAGHCPATCQGQPDYHTRITTPQHK